jgi:hypothetical protein
LVKGTLPLFCIPDFFNRKLFERAEKRGNGYFWKDSHAEYKRTTVGGDTIFINKRYTRFFYKLSIFFRYIVRKFKYHDAITKSPEILILLPRLIFLVTLCNI